MTTLGTGNPPPVQPPWSGPRPHIPQVPDDGPFTADRPKASWGARAVAVLLDSAVVATVVWAATGATVTMATLPWWGGRDEPPPGTAAWWTAGTMIGVALLQAYTGMSPGKRAAGIAVVDAVSGRPIGFLGTVLRWLAHFLDAFLLIGYLRAAWHPEGRTFADSLLGTVAIRSTSPQPHPWVSWLRRVVPGLRWPSWITSAAALVVCALAAAACLVTGGGSEQLSSATASCRGEGPLTATAVVETTTRQRWESRLGVRRYAEPVTQVVAGWTTGFAVTDPDGDGGEGGEGGEGDHAPVTVVLSLRSPDGVDLTSVYDDRTGEVTGDDPDGATWLSTTLPDRVGGEVAVEAVEDLTGWTARTVLAAVDDGTVLAECGVPVPVPGG